MEVLFNKKIEIRKMENEDVPLSIENDWNSFYEKYPERYDLFAKAPIIEGDTYLTTIQKQYSFTGKIIADIASGTGLSTFSFAKISKFVYGIEPERSMRELSLEKAKTLNLTNVEFIEGSAFRNTLKDNSVDVVAAITPSYDYSRENIENFDRESKRIVSSKGLIFSVNPAPKSYGGELYDIIDHDKSFLEREWDIRHQSYTGLGYLYIDFSNVKDYTDIETATKTYGFIFGKKAIDYLIKHNKHTIKWTWRIYYKLLN